MPEDNIHPNDSTTNPPTDDDSDSTQTPMPASGGDSTTQSSASGALPKPTKRVFSIPSHPNTQFNDTDFLDLLEGSISLTLPEKQAVIDAIPRLSQAQIDELISIFTEERTKFAELEKNFSEDVNKLKQERQREMESSAHLQEEKQQEENNQEEIERLRREAGL